MGNRLKALREERGWTHERAAEAMGMSRSHFIKLERGERKLSEHTIRLACEAFGVEEQELFAKRQVPLIGWVGAGGLEHRFGDGDGEYESVEAPPNATEKTVAVEARGDSLGPLLDNAYIYYDDRRDPYVGDFLGEMCVVGLADGQILVKQIRRGTQLGRYTLYGQFGTPLEDVKILWAARVKAIIPRTRATPPGA